LRAAVWVTVTRTAPATATFTGRGNFGAVAEVFLVDFRAGTDFEAVACFLAGAIRGRPVRFLVVTGGVFAFDVA
jgi:hypothetical protein